jgi:hypothetical protein
VEVGAKEGLRVVVVEQLHHLPESGEGERSGRGVGLKELLEESIPVLSGSARRAGVELEGSGWAGKTVNVGRVLGRWFRFGEGEWATQG